jgi:hypothetical protein
MSPYSNSKNVFRLCNKPVTANCEYLSSNVNGGGGKIAISK